MSVKDCPQDVREGESIDEVKLRAYLSQQDIGVNHDTPIDIKQYPSGFSNLTYLITQGSTQYVLRRPPYGTKARSAHDMNREFRVLTFLEKSYPEAPQPIHFCDDKDVMDSDFYLMEPRHGVILRKLLPKGLTISSKQAEQLTFASIDAQIRLHELDYSQWPTQSEPTQYVSRQIDGWSDRYKRAITDDAPSFSSVMNWLQANQPKEYPISFIHNDFKLDNVVFDPEDLSQVIGILDWEMATIGNPLMDLGNSLAYWVEKEDPEFMQAFRTLPSPYPGFPKRQEIIDYYCEKRDLDPSPMSFYYTFGLFRLAVIAQQIYLRYKKGQTKDPRFAQLIFGVKGLEHACNTSIETSKF